MRKNILEKFAARLNSFKIDYKNYWPGKNKISTLDLLTRASKAGINATDLNFPDHFEDIELQDLKRTLKQLDINLNGLAMRYYSDAKFKLGAFTNPEKEINLPNVKELENGQKIIIGIRPEYLFPSKNGIPAKIAVVEPTGSETHLLVRANNQDLTCVIRERTNYSPGQEVKLTADKNSIHIFNYENKLRIY